jgi:type VI protein secretion system component Hcp
MAEYGCLFQNAKIKGNVTLPDFKECIPLTTVTFSSSAMKTGVRKEGGVSVPKLSIEQSPVSFEMRAGKWLAELQQALYDVVSIGDVTIVQCAQTVDKASTAKPTVVQKITLTNAVVTSIQQAWDNGDGARSASVSLSFDKILFEIGTKPADFTLKNYTDKAV